MGFPRKVEIDPARGDHAGEEVDRKVAELARPADVSAEVSASEDEVGIGQPPARLSDQLPHPVPAELVAVGVEEDVVLLLHRQRRKQFRIGAPEQSFRPFCP